MAITSSAKKALRSSLKKRVFNVRRKNKVEDSIRQIKKLVAEKRANEAAALLPTVYKALDKAAKSHTLKKGAADRKKSRMALFVNKHLSVSK